MDAGVPELFLIGLASLNLLSETAAAGFVGGPAHFTYDQPSDQFGSFGSVEVAAVGIELDRKLAALLFHLGVSIPDALLTT